MEQVAICACESPQLCPLFARAVALRGATSRTGRVDAGARTASAPGDLIVLPARGVHPLLGEPPAWRVARPLPCCVPRKLRELFGWRRRVHGLRGFAHGWVALPRCMALHGCSPSLRDPAHRLRVVIALRRLRRLQWSGWVMRTWREARWRMSRRLVHLGRATL